jgi:cellulose synthase (UDP-forming)
VPAGGADRAVGVFMSERAAGGAVSAAAAIGFGATPPPERARRRLLIRIAGVGAVLVTAGYLGWRVVSTLDGAAAWLAAPFLALELHALLSFGLHVFDLWDLDAAPRPEPAAGPAPRVAVLIPTYNEPREVLLPTVAAAVALRPAHQTWVLDDGGRAWVAELAGQLGARYHARSEHRHAKAGNINAVLPLLDADLVAVFDADHVAHAGFLTATLPYFTDPRVALVQTPQDFYNVASFEHVQRRRGARFSEQDLFYRALSAGRNRWNAAFWCGTNAVLRLSALRSVGGVATDTVTEDIHTTIRLHRRGWRTVYHNEVLARGLSAGTSAQFLSQRLRWGTGAMQVLRTENPALVGGLTGVQRLSYLATLLGWFDSWRTLGYLLLPLATVLAGALPLAADPWVFLPWFIATIGSQRLALRLLSRGHATVWHAILFEIIRLPANLAATLTLFGGRSRRFTVTAKGRSDGPRRRPPAPPLLAGLLAAQAVGLAWYAATLAGWTPVRYAVPWTAHGSAFWIAVNGATLAAAIHRIRAPRFAAERRAGVRFDLTGPATVDGTPAELRDVSLTGASLVLPAGTLAVGQVVTLALSLAGNELTVPAAVRSVTPAARPPGELPVAQAGVEFRDVPAPVVGTLALALFRTGITPRLVHPATAPADYSDRVAA